MSIRDYIVQNFKNDNEEELKVAIEESIESAEEMVLPGMGVLFETLWKNSNDDLKKTMLEIIKNNLT